MNLSALHEDITPEELDSVNDILLKALQNKEWNEKYYPLIISGIKDGTLDIATLKQWIALGTNAPTNTANPNIPASPPTPSPVNPNQNKSTMTLDISQVPDDIKEMFNYLNGKFFGGQLPSDIPVAYKNLPGNTVGLTTIDLITETDPNGQPSKDKQGRPIYKIDANGQPVYKPNSATIDIDQLYNPNGWYDPDQKADTKRQLIGILLHEMTHAYFDTHGRPGEGHHKNFQAKLSAIAQQIGLSLSDLIGDYQSDMNESFKVWRIKQLAGV